LNPLWLLKGKIIFRKYGIMMKVFRSKLRDLREVFFGAYS